MMFYLWMNQTSPLNYCDFKPFKVDEKTGRVVWTGAVMSRRCSEKTG